MKALKHLLNATEGKTYRNELKTYYIRMLNDLVSYRGQIFKQNPLFFIIQEGKNTSKTCQVETN